MLKYEGSEYDLDNLFQYEMLKRLIEALAKNQQNLSQRIAELEDKEDQDPLTAKGNECNYYYHHHSNSKGKEAKSLNDITVSSFANDSEGQGIDGNNNHNPLEEELKEKDAKSSNSVHHNANSEVLSRIVLIEKRLKEVGLIRKLIKATDKTIESQNANLQSIREKVEVNSLEINDIKELIPNGNELTEAGDLDEGEPKDINDNSKAEANKDDNKGLIKKLEFKTITKFALIDKRTKLIQDEARKTKENQTEIKFRIDLLSNQIAQFGEEGIKKNQDVIEMINSANKQLSEKIDSIITSKDANTIKQESEETFCPQLLTMNNIQEQEHGHEQDQNEEEEVQKATKDKVSVIHQKLKQSNKRITELEKGLNAFKSGFSINEITESIVKLQGSQLDKNDLSNVTYQISQMKNKLNELKDFTESLEKNIYNQGMDMKSLFKKIENVTGTILAIQDGAKDPKKSLEGFKYVALRTFNAEISKIAKSIDSMIKDHDEFRKQISDMQLSLGDSVNKSDLNKLDKALKASLEESKLSFHKMFANKAETKKAIKVIDSQLKQLMIDIANKTEKSDTCLLAAKTIGYKCASCEAEIVHYDHSKYNYLPWKNYPLRDCEISHRQGNGFSHLLQKLSRDGKKTEDCHQLISLYESDDDDDNHADKRKRFCSEGKKVKRGKLSKINHNNLGRNNKVSIGIIDSKRLNTSQIVEPKVREPKPVKIYKKAKPQVHFTDNKFMIRNESNYISDQEMSISQR